MRFKDYAICIRHVDWSETSQIVTLLTERYGKIRGVAKGAKRTSPAAVAKFSGGIELLTMGEVLGSAKPSAELATLTEWDLQQPWAGLRRDLNAMNLGLYGADLANALLQDHDAHPASFAALRELLEAFNNVGGTDEYFRQRSANVNPATDKGVPLSVPPMHEAALLRFQWAMLVDAGYRPVLAADVRTGEVLAEAGSYLFDARGGGLTVDPAASPGGGGAAVAVTDERSGAGPWRVRRETIATLRAAETGSLAAMTEDDRRTIARANRLLCVYARAILDRELPTMRFVI